jgi:hypothetical protein
MVSEEELVRLLGLRRAEVRQLREKYERDLDWYTMGNRVYWRPSGIEKIATALRPPPAPENSDTAPLEAPAASAVPPLETLEVVQWAFPNRHVLQCCSLGGTEKITVRVKDNRLFRPGQKLLARPVPGSAWEFAGDPGRPEFGIRYPRRPGHW